MGEITKVIKSADGQVTEYFHKSMVGEIKQIIQDNRNRTIKTFTRSVTGNINKRIQNLKTRETLLSFTEEMTGYKYIKISEKDVNIKYEKSVSGEIDMIVEYKTQKIRKHFRKSVTGRVEVEITDHKNGITKEFLMTHSNRIEINIKHKGIIEKKFVKSENGAVEINFLDHKNMIYKKMSKSINGDLRKRYEDKKNNIIKEYVNTAFRTEVTVENKKKGITAKLEKLYNNKLRKTVKNEKDGTSKITIIGEDGQPIEISNDEHNFIEKSSNKIDYGRIINANTLKLRRSDFGNIVFGNGETKGIFEQHEGSISKERVKIGSVTFSGETTEKQILINRGIILLENNDLYVEGYPECTSNINFSALPEFECISHPDFLVGNSKNFGYVIHYSRNGEAWRTKNATVINKLFSGDNSFFDDCGYTEYIEPNNERIYIENNGIIEYNKFVINSKNLCSCGPKCYGYFFVNRILIMDYEQNTLNILKPNDVLCSPIKNTSSKSKKVFGK